ncbi:sel1 repeat family protein [Helicobacter pylori]|nr:sel1 repeat family protein [Helicobacter pylori]
MSVKKAVFRVLYLGVLCLCGGLMAEQDSKELMFSGITIYMDKNFTRAKKYFEKACGLNDADGCIILREIYSKAITRENARESIKKALEHTATAKACQLNNAKGCYALAALYNEGVAKDEKQMTENLKKACELGLKEACDILKEQK